MPTHLHRVGECHEAQAAPVHEDGVEQGPHDVVGHSGLAMDVDHRSRHGRLALGRPQHGHLVFLLEHLIGWGHRPVGPSEQGLGCAVHGGDGGTAVQRPARTQGPLSLLRSFDFSEFPFPGFWGIGDGLVLGGVRNQSVRLHRVGGRKARAWRDFLSQRLEGADFLLPSPFFCNKDTLNRRNTNNSLRACNLLYMGETQEY